MSEKKDRTPEEIAAEVEKARAEATKAMAEATKITAEAAVKQIELDRENHKRTRELASDEHHHVYRFNKPVGADSVKACMEQLNIWNRTNPGCDIEIIFTSPGGSSIDGMALWDYLQQIKRDGHHLTTSSLGYAASMAGILLQAGHHRVMGKESWLLIHEASFGAQGSFGDVSDTVEWVKKMQERILDIFADRSNMTKAAIKRKWHRTDWWLSSDEALKRGFCDETR